jgi:DeoR/GlpR family transcriptional regulator of sugar metabolism
MHEPLFVEERRRAILGELRKYGRVSVKALSETMHVSAVTIRQDLRALEDNGLLERTYGGAVSRLSDPGMSELAFHVRQTQRSAAKKMIAQTAVNLVKNGDCIALDPSTTTYALVPFLRGFERLTILTNSLVIAQSFLDNENIHIIMPGGRVRRDSISVTGRPEDFPNMNVNIFFMSARGVTLNEGITEIGQEEVMMRQAMIARSVEVVLLVDGSKWGQVAPYTIAKPQQISRIITTADAPPDMVGEFRTQGIVVELVPIAEK